MWDFCQASQLGEPTATTTGPPAMFALSSLVGDVEQFAGSGAGVG